MKLGTSGYDASFQRKMIRVLFQDQDFVCTTAAHLKPEVFDSPAHRWLARTIVGYAARHGAGIGLDGLRIERDRAVKLKTLKVDHRSKVNSLIKAIDRPVPDRSFVKEELYRFIKHQAINQAMRNSLEHLDKLDFDAIDVEWSHVLDVKQELSGGLGHSFVKDVRERTKRRKSYEKNGISTGTKLDEFMKPGGLPPKALGVVLAPSGKGKSHCLIHIGKSAVLESDAKVLHITTELSEEMIADRYDAAFANIDIKQLEQKRGTVKRAVRELGTKYGDFLRIKEFAPATLTARALLAFVRQLERIAFYPTLIVIDSADDMIPFTASRDHNAYDDYGMVYRELRKLSYDLGLPIWTASQTNKDALNKEFVDWNAVADSSKKIMVADAVIILLQTLAEKKQKAARLFFAKNRFGGDKFDIKVQLDWSRSLIRSR